MLNPLEHPCFPGLVRSQESFQNPFHGHCRLQFFHAERARQKLVIKQTKKSSQQIRIQS